MSEIKIRAVLLIVVIMSSLSAIATKHIFNDSEALMCKDKCNSESNQSFTYSAYIIERDNNKIQHDCTCIPYAHTPSLPTKYNSTIAKVMQQ